MHVNTGSGYALFEFNGYIFLSSADCSRYGVVILGIWHAFYYPLPLSRSGR